MASALNASLPESPSGGFYKFAVNGDEAAAAHIVKQAVQPHPAVETRGKRRVVADRLKQLVPCADAAVTNQVLANELGERARTSPVRRTSSPFFFVG